MLVAQVSAFGRPDAAVGLLDQPDPGEPGADEVIIDAEFAPINPADLLNLEGRYGAMPPKLPMIPGAEGVGRIAKVGLAVSHVKPGDRVILPGPGCWRERCKAAGQSVFALPGNADAKQLAMLRGGAHRDRDVARVVVASSELQDDRAELDRLGPCAQHAQHSNRHDALGPFSVGLAPPLGLHECR